MGIDLIPIPNTHTQNTQFLGTKYNFGFGYIPILRFFLCVNVWLPCPYCPTFVKNPSSIVFRYDTVVTPFSVLVSIVFERLGLFTFLRLKFTIPDHYFISDFIVKNF